MGNSRVIGKLLRRTCQYSTRRALTALIAVAALVSGQFATAQQQDLSQELQLFNSLPQTQQQAILQQFGGGGGLGGGSLGGLGSGFGGAGLGNGSPFGGLNPQNPAQAALLQQQLLQ